MSETVDNVPADVLELARLAAQRLNDQGYDRAVEVFAGLILADRALHREQLEAEGWRFVEPGYMALPKDRKEAEMMSVVADAYLSQPNKEQGI